jgi:alkylated DNA repair dioxygenase AlkB
MDDLFSELISDETSLESHIIQDGELLISRRFILPEKADAYFQLLLHNIQWKQEEIVVFGKKHFEPRLTAWYANQGTHYAYSNKILQPKDWSVELTELKTKIEKILPGKSFNSVLLNLYRDGNDKMGWHSDNEKELGPNPCIASLSFGATRYFDLKHKQDKTKRFRFELSSGMLLVMSGSLQDYWLHQVPQQKKVKEPRINLTFREVV